MSSMNEKQDLGSAHKGRPFTLLERFCMTRELLGSPQHITTITTYPLASLPSSTFLAQRIQVLQEHYPALYSAIKDRKTRKPKWVPGVRPWTTSEVLATTQISPDTKLVDLLQSELERFCAVDMDQGIYWQIRRHEPSTPTPNGVGYVTVSATHTLMDGRALLYFSEALLARDPPTPYEPAISITLDPKENKPGMREVVPLVWHHLILPKLPRFMRKILPHQEPAWPEGESIKAKPKDFPPAYSYLAINATLAYKVKAVTKERGMSYHIVLKVAFMLAMWKVLRPNGKVRLRGTTPRDDRALPQHPRITGVFPSSSVMAGSFSSDTDFWQVVAKWTKQLRSPKEAKHVKRNIGVLGFIPDPANFKSDDPRRCTGWEDFYLEKLEEEGPGALEGSMELSNINGLKLPPGATDFAWVQPPFAVGSAIQISTLGHEGGVRFVSCWRDGFCVTREQINRMQEVFVNVLEGLVAGGKTTAGQLTG